MNASGDDRLAHRVVEIEQPLPARRDLHRVDERAGVEHLRHAEADRVAVREPALARALAEILAAGALELDDGGARLGLGAARARPRSRRSSRQPRCAYGSERRGDAVDQRRARVSAAAMARLLPLRRCAALAGAA